MNNYINGVGDHNLLPQNFSLACGLKLKTIKAQKIQVETLTFPLTAKKNSNRGPLPRIELSPDISTKNMG